MVYVDKIKACLKRKMPWLVSLAVYLRTEGVQFRLSYSIFRLAKKKRIRVAFLVVFDSVFHFERLFQLMEKDRRFVPFIVVIPEIDRGQEWGMRQYKTVLSSLKNRYADKVIGYCEHGQPIMIEEICDLCIVMNSYDTLTMPQYGIAYLGKKGIPVVNTNYGCDTGTHYTKFFCNMGNLAFLWRFYCGTKFYYGILSQAQRHLRLHKRILHSGVVKMDLLDSVIERPRRRKRILICPHHSIEGSSLLSLSNFQQYAELFQRLPQEYPDIDWVFRPHPLLKSALQKYGHWSEDDWKDYIDRLCSNANVQYIPDGSCYDMFVNSDGMIQDCGSFLAEYHYTGHPQCYMLKSESHAESQYMDWGLELLSHTYKAFSESDIYDFIDKVIVNGTDVKKAERMAFVRDKMCYNYPHVNEWILDDIKKSIWGRKV